MADKKDPKTSGLYRQYIAGFSAGLSVLIAGCWLGWPSPNVKRLQEGVDGLLVSPDDISTIVALMDFGNTLSPIPSGYIMDCLGRKTTLLGVAIVFLASWVIPLFAKVSWLLFVARILAGMGKGVGFTVVPMYLAEIAGTKVRGAISTIFTGCLYGGIMLAYAIGPYVSYFAFNLMCASVPLILFFSLLFVPESPYFYLMKGHTEKARRSLCWYRAQQYRGGGNSLVEPELLDMKKSVESDMKNRGKWRDLVGTPGNRKAMVIVMTLSAFQRLSGISPMLAYTPTTLPESEGGLGPNEYMIMFGILMVVGNFVGSPLLDVLGRKPLLIVSCISCACVTLAEGVFYMCRDMYGKEAVAPYNWVPYACTLAFGLTYSLGIGIIPTTLLSELFPANIKSYASAIAAIFFAVASFGINKFYLIVAHNLGTHYNFYFYTVCSVFSAAFSWLLVFETKGKTFPEIQKQLHLLADGRRDQPQH